MRRSLGTAVFSGMLGVTLFGIFLTPVFFYVIQGLSETRLFVGRAGALDRLGVPGRPGWGWRPDYLLARLGAGSPVWAMAIGGIAGAAGRCSPSSGSIARSTRDGRASRLDQSSAGLPAAQPDGD